MEQFKKILWKVLFPHMAVVIVSVPIAVALLIYAFSFEDANMVIT